MAAVDITNVVAMGPNVKATDFTLTSVSDTTNGAIIPADQLDERTIFLVTTAASGGASLTVKAGNGYAGTADLTIPTIAQNKYTFFTLDSARYKNVSGTNKGKIVIVPSATVSMAVLQPKV